MPQNIVVDCSYIYLSKQLNRDLLYIYLSLNVYSFFVDVIFCIILIAATGFQIDKYGSIVIVLIRNIASLGMCDSSKFSSLRYKLWECYDTFFISYNPDL